MLDKPKGKQDWKGGVGYVTENVVKERLPPPDDANWILVCGPPPMMNVSDPSAPKVEQALADGAC
jgi:NAD(P)H-flavin reductase